MERTIRFTFFVAFALFIALAPRMLGAQEDQCYRLNADLYGPNGLGGEGGSPVERYQTLKKELDDLKNHIDYLEHQQDQTRGFETQYFAYYGKANPEYEAKLHELHDDLQTLYKQRAALIPQIAAQSAFVTQKKAQLRSAGCTPWKNGERPDEEHHRGNADAWAGTYHNGANQTLTVNGSGESLTFTQNWTQPGSEQGSNEQGTCSLNGTTATCEVRGEYHDGDKNIDYQSSVTLTLSGTAIGYHSQIQTARCDAKKVPSCDQLGYTPSITPGAQFSATFVR
jgi:hypothetical protein